MAGAPEGNTNAATGKLWRAAINRALDNRSKKGAKDALDKLAEKFLSECDQGQGWAFRELGDRLDGKAVQPIAGADGGPLIVEIVKFSES